MGATTRPNFKEALDAAYKGKIADLFTMLVRSVVDGDSLTHSIDRFKIGLGLVNVAYDAALGPQGDGS